MKPRVHDAPAIAVLQRIDVHVIELHREGQAEPQDALGDLNGFGFGGGCFVGELDFVQGIGFAYGLRSGKRARHVTLALG